MKSHMLMPAVFLLLPLTACFNEKAVMEEMDRYAPPAVYGVARAAATPGRPLPDNGLRREDDFSRQREALLAMKQSAESAQSRPDREGSFYVPEPGRLEALAPSLDDPEASGKMLAGDFPLADLELLAWGRNPMIKAAENGFRAALESYDQVAGLDEILDQYAAFTAGSMVFPKTREEMGAMDRQFPFPGITALKGRIVTADIAAARQDLEIARRRAITETRRLYWDLVYNRKAVEIISQTLVLLDGFEASTRKRYASGRAFLREPVMLRIRKEKLKEKQISLIENGRSLEARLKALLLLPGEAVIGQPAGREGRPELPSLKELNRLAAVHRQELIRMRSMIARMEWMIEMGETDIYPGFSPAASFSGMDGTERPAVDRIQAAMDIGLPLKPFTGLSDAYLRETRQRLEALRRELEGLTADTVADVREGWTAADRAKREEQLYREKLSELSRLNYLASLRAYESGELSFAETVEALLLELSVRLAGEKRRAELHIAVAELKAAVGFSWPENRKR
ncbi:MAG: TolC family protein [Thermodesulfobacteriota bacterium]